MEPYDWEFDGVEWRHQEYPKSSWDCVTAGQPIEVDERWIADWVKFGFVEMEKYLSKHTAFRTWCDNEEK